MSKLSQRPPGKHVESDALHLFARQNNALDAENTVVLALVRRGLIYRTPPDAQDGGRHTSMFVMHWEAYLLRKIRKRLVGHDRGGQDLQCEMISRIFLGKKRKRGGYAPTLADLSTGQKYHLELTIPVETLAVQRQIGAWDKTSEPPEPHRKGPRPRDRNTSRKVVR
ncbi:hypothetical protein BJX96DRAFT_143359 [Aspergillus floccosus]